MYTKKVKLMDITEWDVPKLDSEARLSNLRLLEKYWGKSRQVGRDSICSLIQNPISHPIDGSPKSYLHLFSFLLNHPNAYELSVKYDQNPQEWIRIKVYQQDLQNYDDFISEFYDHINWMAELASEDKRKDNYLEMTFRARDKDGKSYGRSAVMEFMEFAGKVVGYQIFVPPGQQDIFTCVPEIDKEMDILFNHAIWVPDARLVRQVTSNHYAKP